jgi:hypothetical protein
MGREEEKIGFFAKERIKGSTCILHDDRKYKLITNTIKFNSHAEWEVNILQKGITEFDTATKNMYNKDQSENKATKYLHHTVCYEIN